MVRPIPPRAAEFIASFEGEHLRAYFDSAGIPTIGYGHTRTVTRDDVVKHRRTITKAQALVLLREDLQEAAERIEARIGAQITGELTESQYVALLSFVFNLGANPNWTIWKRLKARRFDEVPAQLVRFNKARDPKTGQLVVLRGLTRRRAAEVELWEEEGADDREMSGRNVETPPTAHRVGTASFTSGAAAAVGGVSVAATSAVEGLKPFAEYAPWLSTAIAVLGVVIVVAGLVVVWLKAKEAKA